MQIEESNQVDFCFRSSAMANKAWCLLLQLHVLFIESLTASPLNEFISHYESARYDRENLLYEHHRIKRSSEKTITLHLHAFQRSFQMKLSPEQSIFTKDPQFATSQGRWEYDQSVIYSGHLADQDAVKVSGTLSHDGLFEGKIWDINETFIIEPSSKYFTTSDPSGFHSVIYKLSDVKINQTQIDNTYLRSILKQRNYKHGFHTHLNGHNPKDLYVDILEQNARRKRAASSNKNTCELYIKADHYFYQANGASPGTVVNQIVQYVQTVNQIYSAIDFDEDGTADNIRFLIKRILLYTNTSDPAYARYFGNHDVVEFLEVHSEENYDQFCLSYIFTNQDFGGGGVLGLAWTASLDERRAGGICEKYLEINGNYKSLNSGFLTTLNYGQSVPTIVCHLTLAHEIGHNMGSEHDPNNTSCTPGGSNGNYIMYPKATSGHEPNNQKFSTCSIQMMAPIIAAKGTASSGCFIEDSGSVCGNKVIDPGEECDCGWDAECQESCCNPRISSGGNSATPCTLKPNAACSPSQGPCCDSSCQLITAADNHICKHNTSCRQEAMCDSANYNSACPAPVFLPNKTRCDVSQVCLNGECIGSLCAVYSYESCQCTEKGKLCAVCCLVGQDCRSLVEIDSNENVSLVAGSPCNDNQGYCDADRNCKEVTSNKFYDQLKEFFVSYGLEIVAWLRKYPWAAALIGAVVIILIGVCVKRCTKKPVKRRRLVRSVHPSQDREYNVHLSNRHQRHYPNNTVAPVFATRQSKEYYR